MKTNKSVTAVEWIEQHFFLDDNWRRIFEQAKEMEKQQIINAHGVQMKGVNNHKCITGEQYYKETYKQD